MQSQKNCDAKTVTDNRVRKAAIVKITSMPNLAPIKPAIKSAKAAPNWVKKFKVPTSSPREISLVISAT